MLPIHPSPALMARVKRLRGAWFLALAISVITYAYVIVQFPTGNHDWERMNGLEFYSYQVMLGRWFAPAVYTLTGFRQLPILNALLAVVAYVSAGFATGLFIESATKKELPTAAHLVAGLLCALLPFGNWTFYYSWMAAMGPLAQLLCVLSLTYVVRTPRLRGVVWGGAALCVSLATYQSVIDTAAVLFWFTAILWAIAPGAAVERGRGLRTVFALAAAIVLGAALYKLSLSILSAYGLLANTYHFRFISLAEFPARLSEVALASARHLVAPHPFFPVSLKLLLLALMSVGAVELIRRGLRAASERGRSRVLVGALVVLGVALMVFCSKIQFLVSEKATYFDHRFASFGLTYVYVPLIVVAIGHFARTARRVHFAACIVCIWSCVVADLSWQDAHIKQNEYDKRFVDRIIARIESLPDFSYEKSYDLVQLGTIPNIRPQYYEYEGSASPYHNFTIMPSWSPQDAYVGLEPRLQIRRVADLKKMLRKKPTPRVNRLMEHINESRPWPDQSSVAIVENHLVVILDKQGLRSLEHAWKTLR